jgi:hypothetical protein
MLSNLSCVPLQLYTIAKDGAVVVWECSYSLTEMQDYIAKMRGASDTSDRPKANQEDREPMDTTDGGREEEEQGEGLQESSDEGDSGRPILKKPKIANICYWTKKDKYNY